MALTPGWSIGDADWTLPGSTAWAAGDARIRAAVVVSTVNRDFIRTKLRVACGVVVRIRAKLARMGIYYRKRKKTGKNSWINLSGSGASMSTKVGPVTFNSRGGMWVNLPGGLNFRGRWR